MKTTILRCESFDTRVSLEDHLKRVKAGRVLLVMPEKQPPDLSRQDLVLLRRQAADLHAQLGLVTTDAVLQADASSAGLAVFNNKEEARQEPWQYLGSFKPVRRDISALRPRTGRREIKELPSWLRWLIFSLAVCAVLALFAVLLPGGRVKLNLPRADQTTSFVVPASVDLSTPDLIAGTPLYQITLQVKGQVEQRTTGTVSVGDQPARGKVVITNLTDKPLVIPVGMIVRSLGSDPHRFRVEQPGNLPAGPGTTVTLQVKEMDGSGSAGNLPAGAIVAMDSPLGLSVSVTNPEALSGGTRKSSPALAQADLLTAEAAVKEALVRAFLVDASGQLPDDARLIRESVVVDLVHSISTPPPYDRPLSSFELKQEAEMTGTYYLESDLEEWALLAMDASLSVDRVAVPARLQMEILSIDYRDESEAYIMILASRQTIPVFYPQTIAHQLRGLRTEEAVALIQDSMFPGSQPVITLSPSWWFRLPFLPERIHVDG
jgi:hypothetical protein